MRSFSFLVLIAATLSACSSVNLANSAPNNCSVEFVILGIGQDAGAPQIDNHTDRAWQDRQYRLFAASGALVDHRSHKRFLFDATPDLTEQLYALNETVGAHNGTDPLGLAGVFLTHAHIGHYTGLMFAGHESAGARKLPVFAMPRMLRYLESNGPWDQLVRFENITLQPLHNQSPVRISGDLIVTPYRVPHRDEYSETVGFEIAGPNKRVLFLPDIDSWDRWEEEFNLRIEERIAAVDYAYLDATFFDDNELPGRDMSKIPHPRLSDSMQRFSKLTKSEQAKVRFFHINHTNPARFEETGAYQLIIDRGFRLARQNERVCLD